MDKFFNFIKTNLNNLIAKLGCDKFLHFFVGAWLTSLVSPCGVWWMVCMVLFVTAIAFLKEKKIDDVGDMKDFYASVAGSLFSFLLGLIII